MNLLNFKIKRKLHFLFMAIYLTGVYSTEVKAQTIIHENEPNSIPHQYIVVFKTKPVLSSTESMSANDEARLKEIGLFLKAQSELIAKHAGKVTSLYQHAFVGLSVHMKRENLQKYLKDSQSVDNVQPNMKFFLPRMQVVTDPAMKSKAKSGRDFLAPAASWGQDRVDQTDRPLNSQYNPPGVGKDVHTYILDTGVRSTHREFSGRMGEGFNAPGDTGGTEDGNGHGTHVAGTVGGASFGLAPQAIIHSVRVFPWGSGSTSMEIIIRGIDWMIANKKLPASANMSLGAQGSYAPLETAVANAVRSGIVMAIAGGNSNMDACGFTPAREPLAVTVGASDINDARAGFSNWGTCLDLYAPGVNILSASNADDTGSRSLSGTSMAAPHVAGAAAVYLGLHPDATPDLVAIQMVGTGSKGKLSGMMNGDPNILLNVEGYATGLCLRKTPVLAMNPFSRTVTPQGEAQYTIKVTNADSAECKTASFKMVLMADSSLTGSFDRELLALDPKQSADVLLTVRSGNTKGLFNLVAKAVEGASDNHPAGEGKGQIIVADGGEIPLANGLNYRLNRGNWGGVVPDFSKLYPESVGKTPNIIFPLGTPEENLALLFEGYLKIDKEDTYVLGVSSDDGSILYIDGVLLVNNDGAHGDTYREAPIFLAVGYHHYRLGFSQGGGPKALAAFWSSPSITKSAIPASVFYNQTIKYPPLASTSSDQNFKLPQNSTTMTSLSKDVDGTIEKILWSQLSGPNQATLGENGKATITVSNLIVGVYEFHLAVTDNDGMSSTAKVKVTVSPTNQKPVLKMPANQIVPIPLKGITLAAEASDPDGVIASYVWTQISGPKAPFTGDRTNALVVGQMPSGDYEYNLVVTDNDSVSVTGTVRVHVNFSPEVAVTGKTVVVDPDTENLLTARMSDLDGKIVQSLWEIKSSPARFDKNSFKVTKGTVDISTLHMINLVKGDYVVSFTAVDNLGAATSQVFSFRVESTTTPVPPKVDAGADQNVKLPLSAVEFKASASSPSGSTLSYLWEKISGPQVTMEGVNSPSLLVKNLAAGNFIFRITVTDANQLKAQDEVALTVLEAENSAPTCLAGQDQIVTYPVEMVKVPGVVTDVDGNIVSATWRKVSRFDLTMKQKTTKENNELRVDLTLVKPSRGLHVFVLEAVDAKNANCGDTVTITVQ